VLSLCIDLKKLSPVICEVATSGAARDLGTIASAPADTPAHLGFLLISTLVFSATSTPPLLGFVLLLFSQQFIAGTVQCPHHSRINKSQVTHDSGAFEHGDQWVTLIAYCHAETCGRHDWRHASPGSECFALRKFSLIFVKPIYC
jgi:hypothetical protein